jgi:xanthine dehydrogenase accessory factor
LGFEVWIVDNRRAFARAGRFPHADRVLCGPYGRTLRKQAVDGSTAIVIVTHGHLHDEECLEAALRTSAGYVGMIGSRRKIRDIFARLAKKGFKRGALAKVRAPIGLDIGAETPEEIAVAIAAELIEVFRKA